MDIPMATIWKRPWEEPFFWHSFKRTPIKGWLADTETISSISLFAIYDSEDIVQSAMALSYVVDPADATRVKYQLAGGTVGETYTIDIKIVSSTGQKLEDKITLEVVE